MSSVYELRVYWHSRSAAASWKRSAYFRKDLRRFACLLESLLERHSDGEGILRRLKERERETRRLLRCCCMCMYCIVKDGHGGGGGRAESSVGGESGGRGTMIVSSCVCVCQCMRT